MYVCEYVRMCVLTTRVVRVCLYMYSSDFECVVCVVYCCTGAFFGFVCYAYIRVRVYMFIYVCVLVRVVCVSTCVRTFKSKSACFPACESPHSYHAAPVLSHSLFVWCEVSYLRTYLRELRLLPEHVYKICYRRHLYTRQDEE